MKTDPIPFPRVHSPHCRCSACFVQAWNRAANIRHEPIALRPDVTIPDRSAELQRIEEALTPRLSLIARFRAAALPEDLAALMCGTQLGVAMAAVSLLVHFWQQIVAAFALPW